MSKFFSWRQAFMDADLKPMTKLVLHTLACHMTETGQSCYPSQRRIADLSGMGLNTVNRHIAIAENSGWITKSKMGFAGKKWKLSVYEAAWPSGVSSDENCVSTAASQVFPQRHTNTSVNTSSNTSTTCAKENKAKFLELWEYLKQAIPPSVFTRSSKKTSQKKFLAAIKEHGVDKVSSAVKWYYHSVDVSRENHKYAPGLQTMLNQEKFEHFLDKPEFNGGFANKDEERWKAIAGYANKHGEVHSSDPSPKRCPFQYRHYFGKKFHEQHNWKES